MVFCFNVATRLFGEKNLFHLFSRSLRTFVSSKICCGAATRLLIFHNQKRARGSHMFVRKLAHFSAAVFVERKSTRTRIFPKIISILLVFLFIQVTPLITFQKNRCCLLFKAKMAYLTRCCELLSYKIASPENFFGLFLHAKITEKHFFFGPDTFPKKLILISSHRQWG